MHTDPTRISRAPVIGALIVVFALLGLALASMATHAQPTDLGGYTRCGVEATGIDPWLRDKANPQGKSVTAARPGMAVSPEGRWFSCQPWVPQGGDPRMPEPAADKTCPARDTFEVWEVAGLVCTSTPPGDSTSTTMMLPRTEPGRVALLRDDHGAAQGLLVMRCVVQPDRTVRWEVEGQTCGLVPQVAPTGMCSAQTIGHLTSRTRPAVPYTYSDDPVRAGIRVPVRAADGTVRVARCGALGRLEW